MKTQQPTERGLAPSCSSFEKYEMCPGSYNLCLGVAEGPSGPAAQLGTDVHATLAGEAFHLTPEGEAIHNECADAYQKLARKIMPDGPMLTYLEKRLWYNREWSGQADRIDLFESGQSALVVDYKTGRGRVPRAEENLQLRGLAVLAKFRFPMLRRIDVAIIAPRSNGTTYCSYTEGELEIARQEIVRLIKNLHEEDAPRHPSPKACRFCRAKKICPEVTGIAQKLVAAPVRTSKELSADKLAESLGTAEILEGLIKDLREEAKRRLSEGSEVPGYELSPGRITRSIEDPQKAFELLSEVLPPEDFITACRVSVPVLERLVGAKTESKGKALKSEFAEILLDVLKTKETQPVLRATK